MIYWSGETSWRVDDQPLWGPGSLQFCDTSRQELKLGRDNASMKMVWMKKLPRSSAFEQLQNAQHKNFCGRSVSATEDCLAACRPCCTWDRWHGSLYSVPLPVIDDRNKRKLIIPVRKDTFYQLQVTQVPLQ